MVEGPALRYDTTVVEPVSPVQLTGVAQQPALLRLDEEVFADAVPVTPVGEDSQRLVEQPHHRQLADEQEHHCLSRSAGAVEELRNDCDAMHFGSFL